MTAEWQWTALCCHREMPMGPKAWESASPSPEPSDRCALSHLMSELSVTFPHTPATKGECSSSFWAPPHPSHKHRGRAQQVQTHEHAHRWAWQCEGVSDMTHLELPRTQVQDPRTIRLTWGERIYLARKFPHPVLTPKLERTPWLQQIKILRETGRLKNKSSFQT